MAKSTKKWLILYTVMLMSGCAIFRPSTSPPVLKDSDIPYVMAPGEYIDAHGAPYAVTKASPRFAVSEGYIYDSVVRPGLKWYQQVKTETVYLIVLTGIFILALKRR